MGVSFSLHLVPDNLDQIAKRSKFAEDSGFDQVWIAESHLTCRDHNVALAVGIQATSSIKIGPGVTETSRNSLIPVSIPPTLSSMDMLPGGGDRLPMPTWAVMIGLGLAWLLV